MASDEVLSHQEWRDKLSRMLSLHVQGVISDDQMNAEVDAFLSVYRDEEDVMFGRVAIIDVTAQPADDDVSARRDGEAGA